MFTRKLGSITVLYYLLLVSEAKLFAKLNIKRSEKILTQVSIAYINQTTRLTDWICCVYPPGVYSSLTVLQLHYLRLLTLIPENYKPYTRSGKITPERA